MLKRFLLVMSPVVDVVVAVLSIPAGLILKLYRRYGSRRLPASTRVLRGIGVFPIRDHYYEPMFATHRLPYPLNSPRSLPGIDFNIRGQLDLLSVLDYVDEFERFVEEQKADTTDTGFRVENDSFRSGDAEFLFQIIRHFKPRKLIEIGSGTSTKVARAALAMNAKAGDSRARHICIEPFEQPWLERLSDIELVRSRVEESTIDWAAELGSGDLLFIDSSHIIRPQGDVLHEYLQIIPQLASGVIVHVHDIFSPRDYLENWVRRDVRFWNEQYLLEATLGNSARYEIVAALNLLKHEHYEALRRVCPYLDPGREPGSFYFRIR